MIAYLNSEYPSLSHTFIEREIRALRELGVPITTFSVRRPGRHGTIGAAHARAAAETVYLKESAASLLLRGVLSFARSPLGAARAILASQRLSPPGLRARVTHVAYALEGATLAIEMRRRGIMHVHVHMANNGAAVAMMAGAFDPKLRYSLSIHGSAEFFHVDSWTLREKVEGATFVRCISNFCRAQVMAWCGESHWDRLHVVHCGIDLSRFSRIDRTDSATLRLVTVGRLHPIKAYPLLLDACAMLKSRGVDWSLVMVGDGPARSSLEATASRLGISDRATFAGAVSQDDLLPYLAEADAMVVSSCMEGIPVVLMEAMATGMPVVSSNVGGIPELVSAECGFLCPPGSAVELADAIVKLHDARARRRAMGLAARSRIEQAFDLRQTGAGMHELFSSYLGAWPARAGAAPR